MVKGIHIGQKVYYRPSYKKIHESENGIVKSLCEDPNYVWVVYHWSDEEENYKNYTAARTKVADLFEGWVIDGKCQLGRTLSELKQFGLNEGL